MTSSMNEYKKLVVFCTSHMGVEEIRPLKNVPGKKTSLSITFVSNNCFIS